jgi:hypothetical protein
MRRRWQVRTFDPALPELRRRSAWLIRGLDPKTRAFVQLVPLLLIGRFRRPQLDRDAPGVRFAPRRHRWGNLCARLDLPPPSAVTNARPLVQTVVIAPLGNGRLEVLIIAVDDIPSAEVARLVTRVDAMAAIAARHCPALDVRLASRAELTPSMVPWAGVCAGDLPPFDPSPVDRLEVIARAPNPLARCLALLVEDDAPPPLEVLREARGPATPEAFVARWSQSAMARAVVDLKGSSLEELKQTGTALQRACAFALRRLPPRERAPLHALLRRDLFSSLLPAVLRPNLEALVRGQSAVERHDGQRWVMTVNGTELARGDTLDQLRAAALAETPLLARTDSPWARIAQMVAGGQRRTLVIVESGSLKHLVVSISTSRRLHARRVELEGLLRFVLLARARGEACEVMASLGSDQSLVGRLAQISAVTATGDTGVEVGPRLLLASGGHVRNPLTRAALARPRALTWLPADHELLRSLRRPPAGPLPTVSATAWPLGDTRAALIFVDPAGNVLREEVARATLEPHLIESRELLRRAQPSALLSVTVHPELTALAGRRLDSDLPALPLDIDCEWPFTIRVWLEGESFCAPGDLPWSALAESILSRWPPGTWGRVGVRRVGFIRPPPSPSPLHVLAVRSRVLRRIAAGLRRLTRVLEAA